MPMRPEKIKFLLMAGNTRRAAKFYNDTFGFSQVVVSDWWAELAFGDSIIAFHGGHDGSPHDSGLSLQFEDVFGVMGLIEAAGGEILAVPHQREGEPILLGQFRDTEGNAVFITQYVG
jgi:predicted enzyme related to lactoylglutathione lyase